MYDKEAIEVKLTELRARRKLSDLVIKRFDLQIHDLECQLAQMEAAERGVTLDQGRLASKDWVDKYGNSAVIWTEAVNNVVKPNKFILVGEHVIVETWFNGFGVWLTLDDFQKMPIVEAQP